jgi:hypothetical protein
VGDSHTTCVKGSSVLENDDTNDQTTPTDPGSTPDAAPASEVSAPETDPPAKKAAAK